jgi:2-hydroxyglutarate dehydrogenase
MIIGPGACLSFSREGYQFSDVKVGDLFDFLTNGHLWAFVAKNPVLSLSELWKDVNKAAFLRDARKLVPSVTEDMVEPSFTGVMAQVFEADGTAAKDYVFERKCMDGRVLNVRNAPSPACTASLAIAERVMVRV